MDGSSSSSSLLCVCLFLFVFFFTPTPTCLFPRNPTRCKCIRRYAFPYSHPLRSVWCLLHLHLLLILDLSTSLPALGAPSSLTAPSATASLSLSFSHACSWPLILMRHGGCRFCLFMLSDFSYFLIVLLRSSNSSSRNTWCTVSASRGVGGGRPQGGCAYGNYSLTLLRRCCTLCWECTVVDCVDCMLCV